MYTNSPVPASVHPRAEEHGPIECWSPAPRNDVLQQRQGSTTTQSGKNLNNISSTLWLVATTAFLLCPELRIDLTEKGLAPDPEEPAMHTHRLPDKKHNEDYMRLWCMHISNTKIAEEYKLCVP